MKVLAAFVIGFVAILALRYVYYDVVVGQVIAKSSNASSCLAMLGNTTSVEDGQTFIIGNVRNNCDYKFSNVTIIFRVGRASRPKDSLSEAIVYAYARDVKPSETRRFKTAFPISKNAIYRFDKINAY